MEKQIDRLSFIKNFFLIQNDRIFIDISTEGCGNGCLYCYVKTKNTPQHLLSQSQVEYLCSCISANTDCVNKIVSFCPNTEPFKTRQSTELVLWIAKYFLDLGSYVQISTKEFIPDWVLHRLKRLDCSRIFLNISIPFLHNCEIIEPHAATIKNRLDVFLRKKEIPGINLCLYIKPFGKKQESEIIEYISLINYYKITNICVGINFPIESREKSKWPCASLYHRSLAVHLMNIQKQEINRFIAKLRQHTSARIYCSSVCCVYNEFDLPCELQLFHDNEVACADCKRIHLKG